MALTKVHNRMSEGQPVHVADFGAVGDGVTDDTVAIQAAINSITQFTVGEIVFDPAKSYLVTDTVSTNGRSLFINGNKAALKIDANFTGTYVLEVTTTNCTVVDFSVSKATAVVADGAIKVSGTRHRFDRVNVNDGTWSKCFHLVDVKESAFSNIRIDNDPATKTGDIFYLDYSVNNTITNSMLGFCSRAVYLSGLNHPTFSYKSEGLTFTDNIVVYAGRAIQADAVTSLHVDNCVLDFCKIQGVGVSNGNSLFVSNTWIANEASSTSFAGVVCGTGFSRVSAHNNVFFGNATGAGQDAFSSNATYAKFSSNHINGLNFGTINQATSYLFGNTKEGSGTSASGTAGQFEISGSELIFGGNASLSLGDGVLPGEITRTGMSEYLDVKTGDASSDGVGLLASNYGDVPTMGMIYVQETGTANYLIGVWYKRNVAANPVITTLANSTLTINSANSVGTVKISGATTPTNLKFTATIMAVNN